MTSLRIESLMSILQNAENSGEIVLDLIKKVEFDWEHNFSGHLDLQIRAVAALLDHLDGKDDGFVVVKSGEQFGRLLQSTPHPTFPSFSFFLQIESSRE